MWCVHTHVHGLHQCTVQYVNCKCGACIRTYTDCISALCIVCTCVHVHAYTQLDRSEKAKPFVEYARRRFVVCYLSVIHIDLVQAGSLLTFFVARLRDYWLFVAGFAASVLSDSCLMHCAKSVTAVGKVAQRASVLYHLTVSNQDSNFVVCKSC